MYWGTNFWSQNLPWWCVKRLSSNAGNERVLQAHHSNKFQRLGAYHLIKHDFPTPVSPMDNSLILTTSERFMGPLVPDGYRTRCTTISPGLFQLLQANLLCTAAENRADDVCVGCRESLLWQPAGSEKGPGVPVTVGHHLQPRIILKPAWLPSRWSSSEYAVVSIGAPRPQNLSRRPCSWRSAVHSTNALLPIRR